MKVGTVAVCSNGCIGLVTEAEPRRITYTLCDYCVGAISGADDDSSCACVKGIAYVGVHLSNKTAPIGSPWSSRDPRVIGHIDQFVPEGL